MRDFVVTGVRESGVLLVEPPVACLGQWLAFARGPGLRNAWMPADLPVRPFEALIDCTNAAEEAAAALSLVQPSRPLVPIGLFGAPDLIDTRELVLKDIIAVGVLSVSAGLIDRYGDGGADPRPLIGCTLRAVAGGRCVGRGTADRGRTGPQDPHPPTPLSGRATRNST